MLRWGNTVVEKQMGMLEMVVTAHRMEHTYKERKVGLINYWVYLAIKM